MTPTLLLSITSLAASCGLLAMGWMYVRAQRRLKDSLVSSERIRHEQRKNDQLRIAITEEKNRIAELETLLNSLPFPVWLRDESLKIILFNSAYREALNLPADATPEQLPELELGQGEHMVAELARRSEKPQTSRKHLIIHNERKLYECVELPCPGIKGTIGYALNAEEVDKSEQELKQYVSMLSDLMESSASAIAVYGSNMQLKFYNQAFIHMWKLDEQWLDTKPFYGEILETLREKRKLPEQSNFVEFKKTNLALFTNLLEKHEEFYYLPDGRVFRCIVIPHALGGLLFSYEDMTDKISLERSLKTMTTVRKSTIDNLFEGVAVFGEDGRLKLYNPNFVLIWKLPETMLTSEPHLSDILESTKSFYGTEQAWVPFKQSMIAALQSRTAQNQSLELSDDRILEWGCVPLPDGATLMIYRDISDSIRLERSLLSEREVLKEVSELKSKFLANMSYELRSPLTSIMGFSEILSTILSNGMNVKQKDYVKNIYSASRNLTGLIDQIIDVASIDAGYLTPDVQKLSGSSLLNTVMESAALSAKEKRIEIELNASTESRHCEIWCDEKRLNLALGQVMVYALRHAPEQSRLLVRASENDGTHLVITLSVVLGNTDSGIALPTGHDYKTDLRSGLPIAESILDLHGGTLEAMRDTRGAHISITLPLRHQPLMHHAKEAA